MGIKSEDRVIRGLKVTSTQLPARRSFALLSKLLAIAGPSFSKLSGGIDLNNVETMAPAFGEFFVQLNETDADALMLQILQSTRVYYEGAFYDLTQGEIIDTVFSGDLRSMFETMWFALTVNYGDFIDAGELAKLAKKKGEQSPNPEESKST